jgi:predicted MFS family arabinose efflux permease
MDLSPARRAVAMATMVMAQDLGIIAGSSLLGTAGTLGGYGVLFTVGATPGIMAVLGLGVAWRLGRLPHAAEPARSG